MTYLTCFWFIFLIRRRQPYGFFFSSADMIIERYHSLQPVIFFLLFIRPLLDQLQRNITISIALYGLFIGNT